MANRQFQLLSGRKLGMSGIGDPLSRRLVVLCHPSPGAAGFDPDPTATSDANVHMVTLERPGYGGSDELGAGETPSLVLFASDLLEFVHRSEREAAQVGATEFGSIAVVGWGFGALVAAQIAAMEPDLVDRLVLVSPRTEKDHHESDRLQHVLNLLTRAQGDESAPELAAGEHAEATSIAGLGIPDDDPDLHRPGLLSRLNRMLADAFLQGKAGVSTDLTAYESAAGPDWKRITAKTLILVGENDDVAGPTQVRSLGRAISGAEVVVAEGSGPLAIAGRWTQVIDFARADKGQHN